MYRKKERAGKPGQAAKTLEKAAGQASRAEAKRSIDHNRAVLALDKNAAAAEAELEKLGGNPPEALVNLGVLYDRTGRPKEAHDAWVKARERGARAPNLDEWISAKKRIFGY